MDEPNLIPRNAGRLSPFFPRWFPAAIIAVSLGLRVGLALGGGQYFFGDEGRFDRGIQLYEAIAQGRLVGIREIAAQPEHALFPWVGAGATAAQHLLAQFTRYGDWSHSEYIGFTMYLGAAMLSLFSTLNLFLVYRLARLSGAGEDEASWVLLLMAASNTAFYFSRHLLPYDCAMSLALGGLVIGLQAPTHLRAFACGIGTALTYHVYNGYWYVVPVVGVAYLLAQWQRAFSVKRLFAWAAGALLGLALPLAVGWAAGGEQYFRPMLAFSQTVTQGLFAEGWSLPWEYFWHSEGSFGVAIVAAFALAVSLKRHAGESLPPRIRSGLIVLLSAYLLLVALSVGFHLFVVYARTLKPFVAIFCLLGGWALASMFERYSNFRGVAAGVIALVALLNFAPHFTRIFPREAEISVLRTWGNPKHSLSVAGSLYIPLALPVTRPDLALVNAQLLYPITHHIGYPEGETLLRVQHALSYSPFQYESHSPRERTLLRTQDISIRLIKLAAPAAVPMDLPPELRYRSHNRPTGR